MLELLGGNTGVIEEDTVSLQVVLLEQLLWLAGVNCPKARSELPPIATRTVGGGSFPGFEVTLPVLLLTEGIVLAGVSDRVSAVGVGLVWTTTGDRGV